jgi:hypothetical protein
MTKELLLQQYDINTFGFIKAVGEDDGDWLISGPIASLKPDYDGDTILNKAIEMGLRMYERLGGQVDWEHKYKRSKDPDDIIGRSVGYTRLNGQIWMTTLLDKGNALAQKIWRMAKAKTADGKPLHKLGYSVLGKGVKDDNGNVTETEIHFVTIAPQPKGFDQFMQVGAAPGRMMTLCKAVGGTTWEELECALTTGDGIVQEGATGGAALRTQFLKGGLQPTGGKLEPVGTGGLHHPRRRKKKVRIHKSVLDAFEAAGSATPELTASRVLSLIGQWN